MTLPCPGPAPISLLDIQNEFGGDYEIKINEYYRGPGTAWVVDKPENANIPTSGQISFADFFCTNGEIVVIIGSGKNVQVSPLFQKYWYEARPKRLIISEGAVIGSDSYVSGYYDGAALTVDSNSRNGKLTIENRGSIQGVPGMPGGYPLQYGETRSQNFGGKGGNAIRVVSDYATTPKINIQNMSTGSILAGGGGGGFGGTNPQSNYSIARNSSSSRQTYYRIDVTTGSGGFGGYGQGYLQNNTKGLRDTQSIKGQFQSDSGINLTANLTSGSNSQCNSTSGINANYRLASGASAGFNVSGSSIFVTAYLSKGSNSSCNASGGTISGTWYMASGATASFGVDGGNISISIIGPGAKERGISVNASGSNVSISRDASIFVGDQAIDEASFVGYCGDLSVDTGNVAPPNAVFAGDGGTYGNPGSAGQSGSSTAGSPGGSSGYSITGINNVSLLTNSGTISGPQN